jgi:hypothetical protein
MPCKLTLLLLSSLLLSINLFADEAGISPAAGQRLAETKSRLDLSEEQATAMAPILKKNMQQANSVLESYGIDLKNQSGPKEKLGWRKARKLGKEMDKIRANTLEELTPILDERQVVEYKKIQQENKAALRERIRQRRGR